MGKDGSTNDRAVATGSSLLRSRDTPLIQLKVLTAAIFCGQEKKMKIFFLFRIYDESISVSHLISMLVVWADRLSIIRSRSNSRRTNEKNLVCIEKRSPNLNMSFRPF